MARTSYEFRYYQIPAGDYVMALLGKGWEICYGADQPPDQLHFHNYMEVGYCYRGRGELIISERTYRYSGDMFSVIPENIPHTTNSDPDSICKWEFLYFDIDNFIRYEMKDCGMDPEALIRMVNRRGTLKSREHHPMLAGLIREIIEECRAKKPYSREILKAYIRVLVFSILRLDEEHEQLRLRTLRDSNYVGKGMRFIDSHYQEDLHVADVAAVCGLSESHFRRIFEKATRMKPVDYLNMVRVSKACEMLQKENLTMAEVSRKAGFLTPSSFNRNFKALTGMTPLSWRKTAQEGRVPDHLRVQARPGWRPSEWADRYRDIWARMEQQEQEQRAGSSGSEEDIKIGVTGYPHE